MFAGRGQQSLVLTLTADFRKVRHILFGSGYGAKVNIFKWINYPLLWVESRILILFWFFSFSITFTEYPPPKSKLPTFSLSPNPKLQNTPPGIQTSNFFPPKLQNTPPPEIQNSKIRSCRIPPPESKLPTFSLSPNPKLQNTPPKNPNFQLFP